MSVPKDYKREELERNIFEGDLDLQKMLRGNIKGIKVIASRESRNPRRKTG